MRYRRIVNQAVVGVTVAGLTTATHAITIYVDDENCPGPGSGTEADAYCSIQTAIDNAVDTDEIVVAPGTYSETINFLGKAVWLHSTGGPEVTTIDGQGLATVVTCENGEGAATILEGFTVSGGYEPIYEGGGGMLNFGSSPTVTNCIFTSNEAWRGGGMLNDQGSSPTVTSCIFTSNEADYGGGMYNAYSSHSTVTNCAFESNLAPWFGGGMDNAYGSHSTVTNCTFTSNIGYFGGGMFNAESAPTVTNCAFIENEAGFGGGMYCVADSSPVVANCTFSGNLANIRGGGMFNWLNMNSGPSLTNCILWGDTPYEIELDESTITVSYSDVQGGWTGTNNIDADPMFADADGRLALGSPCIDVGDNTAVPPYIATDIDGNPRIVNDTVDLGAYEYITFVQIDIKPGSYPNAVNINGNGVIPVAVVGSAEFDVTQVVIGSLSFAGLEVKVKPNGAPQCSISDVSGPEGVPDGYNDLVCQFVDDPLLWLPGDAIAQLTGAFLVDGEEAPFRGSDEITIVP
jgi:hypothetical protein